LRPILFYIPRRTPSGLDEKDLCRSSTHSGHRWQSMVRLSSTLLEPSENRHLCDLFPSPSSLPVSLKDIMLFSEASAYT
jgi:hypothetical protein